jgi:polysaccharide biosynthesis/export protein
MKKILLIILCTGMFLSANIVQAQQDSGSQEDLGAAALQEVQKADPAAAQAITNAVQRGDLQGAKNIYQNFKKSRPEQPVKSATPQAVAAPPPTSSLFEQALPGNLTQFGYALFNKTVSTFTIPATMPVGPDYIIGPGDQFTLTLWGTTEGIFNLQVTKEGTVTLPKVGVVQVAGIRFGELETTIKSHLSRYYNDFNMSIAMGGLKTITIYVVGEVVTPGSYSLSSLTSVYGALFSAGGPTKMGSLRAIQVLRSGKVIKTLDLYDFLLKGDRSKDIKLQSEDTVFVPLIGPVAGVAGTVYRPAIYELKGQETLSDLIETAGGLLPTALGGRLQLTRYIDNQRKVFLDVKLDDVPAGSKRPSGAFQEKVRNMDAVSIRPLYDVVWETVEVSGAVKNPGSVQWRPDLRLREVVVQGQLLPKTDMRRADVVRMKKEMIERTIIPVDLAALMAGDESQNILLEPKDKVVIYNVDQNPSNVWETVNLSGVVRNPGNFQWRPDLKVREIIIQGQLLPQSDLKRADVIRLDKNLMDRTVIPVDLTALMAGDESKNITLEPQDQVRIYSSFKAAEKVTVSGEVVRAGDYEISKEEHLSDLMRRVGGFTQKAYPYGAVFKRVTVKNSEAKSAKVLITKTQSEIIQNAVAKTATAVTPEDAQFAKAEQSLNQSLLENLKAMQDIAEGRVAISITGNIDEWAGSKQDLLLQDGDTLMVPKQPQEVLVLGEVFTPGAQIFLPEMSVGDYLSRTGGLTRNADSSQIFVVRADGFSFGPKSLSSGSIEAVKLQAGDAVFVPQKVEREAALRTTKDIIDILFKTAVVFATIHLLF